MGLEQWGWNGLLSDWEFEMMVGFRSAGDQAVSQSRSRDGRGWREGWLHLVPSG